MESYTFPETRDEILLWALATSVPVDSTWFDEHELAIGPHLKLANDTLKWIDYVCETYPDLIKWRWVEGDEDKIIPRVAGIPIGKINIHRELGQTVVETARSNT